MMSWQDPEPKFHACPAASAWSVHSVTAAPTLGRHQMLPLQAEEAAALAAGLAAAEQRVQAVVGAREAEMQAQAEAVLRASVLAQAQQRVQEQVGPLQDCHWHRLGSLLLVQYAQLAKIGVDRGRCLEWLGSIAKALGPARQQACCAGRPVQVAYSS